MRIKIENKPKDVITCLCLDQSGSMYTNKEETIGGVNSYIENLRQDNISKTYFTLVKFNTNTQVLYDNVNVNNVELLNNKTYIPGGYTALFDAIYESIGRIDRKLAQLKASHKATPNVLLCIVTDGQENASKEVKHISQIKTLIEKKRSEGWTIVFLGHGLENWSEGQAMGLHSTNIFDTKNVGYRGTYSSMSTSTQILRRKTNDDEVLGFLQDDAFKIK